MNHIVLYQPEIPPNTGNIARTCAGTDTVLHLIHPLGFSLDDKHLKRAGLDYWHELAIVHHESLSAFVKATAGGQYYLVTKFARQLYSDCDYTDTARDHYFIFGRETSGLPADFMQAHVADCIRIPMDDTHIRSLNLSNTAAIIIYEALRQQAFVGLDLYTDYLGDKLKSGEEE